MAARGRRRPRVYADLRDTAGANRKLNISDDCGLMPICVILPGANRKMNISGVRGLMPVCVMLRRGESQAEYKRRLRAYVDSRICVFAVKSACQTRRGMLLSNLPLMQWLSDIIS